MWFFDSVLEEKPQTIPSDSSVTISSSSGTSGSSSSGTKKDDQDGSFLIVDNSITVDSIPDTAVQLFDEPVVVTPVQEVNNLSEISFFSEPVISKAIEPVDEELVIVENSSPAEIAFFDEPVIVNTEVTPIPEITTESAQLITFMNEPSLVISPEITNVATVGEITPLVQEEAKVSDIIMPVVVEVIKEEIIQSTYVPEKNDIYAPMKRAIAEYEKFLAALMEDAKKEDAEIEAANARIAEAKEIAKKAIDLAKELAKQALEKRKILDGEMKRIKEMSDTLALQIQ